MGSNHQPAGDLRGAMLPDERVLGATITATSQAGPRPGVPVADVLTSLVLEASGTLDEALDDITVATSRAGSPGLLGATFRWKYSGEDLRSWDPPTAVQEWEFVDRSGTADYWTKFHAVRLPDTGLVLCAAVKQSTEVVVWRQTSLGKWSDVSVEDTGNDTCATLCVLPSGRVVCHYVAEVTGVSGSATQIRMAYSDDSGTTWEVGSSTCLKTALTKTADKYLRLRSFYLAGKVGLLVWEQDAADKVYQCVSDDGGATLSLLETSASSVTGCPDVKVRGNTAYVTWLVYDSGGSPTTQPYLLKITSPSQALSGVEAVLATSEPSVEWASISGGLLNGVANALLVDDDGALYLYGRNHTGGGYDETFVTVSLDDGATWLPYWFSSASGITSQTLDNFGDASNYLRDHAVVAERGRAILFHRFAGTAGDSLCAAYLGGWTNVGMPEDAVYDYGRGVAGWNILWIPVDKPSDIGTTWSEATTGAPSSTLSSSGMTITTAVGEARTYDSTPTVSAPTHGIEAEFHLVPSSGSARHDVTISNGTNDFSIRVTVTTTSIILRDKNAGTDLDTITVDTTDGVAILVAVDTPDAVFTTNTGRVRAYYRVTGPYTGVVPVGPKADRYWTEIGSHDDLVHGSATLHVVKFGFTSQGEATWKMVAYNHESYTAGNIVDNPALRGRTLPTSVSPAHVVEGLRLSGVGATVKGDTWTVPTAYDHPVSAVDPSLAPSPDRRWRSTDDGTQQDIVWHDVDLGCKAGDFYAFYVDGCNWQTGALYRDSTGANKVADIDMATGMTGLSFTRVRDCLYPTGGGGNDARWHFHAGVLAGAHVDLGGGVVRRVRTNDAGGWLGTPSPSSYVSARIYLESYDAGDPSSGTMDLVLPRALILTTAMQGAADVMLRIDGQDTAEGYHEVGVATLGRVRVFAAEWGLDYGISWTPIATLSENRGGTRRGRRRGPTREAWELRWQEGVDTSGLYTAGGSADYVTLGYGGADALATYSDTPRTLAGVIDRASGATIPVVLASAIPQVGSAITSNTPIVVNDPTVLLYGRIVTETLLVDNITGHEGREPGPMLRVGTVRVEREV